MSLVLLLLISNYLKIYLQATSLSMQIEIEVALWTLK